MTVGVSQIRENPKGIAMVLGFTAGLFYASRVLTFPIIIAYLIIIFIDYDKVFDLEISTHKKTNNLIVYWE